MPNPNYDALLSTTLQKMLPKMREQAFARCAFGKELTRKDRVKKSATGTKIQIPVNFSLASGGSSYSGYDTLSTDVWSMGTSAEFNWKQYQQPIMLDGRTIRLQSGPEGVIRLLPEKVKTAEKTIMENLNAMWLGAGEGNGGKDFLGIGTLIGDASDTITTVGGIPCTGTNAETKWQSHVQRNAGNFLGSASVGTGNTANGLVKIRKALTQSTWGSSSPQAFFTDVDIYDAVFSSFLPNTRYTDTEMANAGFDNVQVYGRPCYFDTQLPAGPGGDKLFYGIDFEALSLYGHPQAWFTTTEFVTPPHKDSKWAYILLQGELTISERRTSFRIEFDGA